MPRPRVAEKVPGLGKRIRALMLERDQMQPAALIAAARLSRPTVYRALSDDEASSETVERLAEALGVPVATLTAGEPFLTAGRTTRLPESGARVERSHAVRVWRQEFQLELVKGHVPDELVDEAMDLVCNPRLFSFYAGGRAKEATEEQALEAMEAIAKVVRARLKKLGFKLAAA